MKICLNLHFLFDGRRLLKRKKKEEIGFEFYAIGS